MNCPPIKPHESGDDKTGEPSDHEAAARATRQNPAAADVRKGRSS